MTALLGEWARGNRGALDSLMPLVYGELRKIADAYLRNERRTHTLQPTALVHEAWLRLARAERPGITHRKHFYALAAQMMRRILVDHARALGADKRGGGLTLTTLEDAAGRPDRVIELLALDEALNQLARLNERHARVIELRYFGGLGVEEVAELLDVSIATVSRDQKAAEAWLSFTLASHGHE